MSLWPTILDLLKMIFYFTKGKLQPSTWYINIYILCIYIYRYTCVVCRCGCTAQTGCGFGFGFGDPVIRIGLDFTRYPWQTTNIHRYPSTLTNSRPRRPRVPGDAWCLEPQMGIDNTSWMWFLMIPCCGVSMDWFMGKSMVSYRFSREIWGFPVDFAHFDEYFQGLGRWFF